MTDLGDRSVGEILVDIKGNVERLVRAEIRMIKTGAVEWAKDAAGGTALVAAGVVFAILTLALLLVALIAGLAESMPLWQAALVVGGGLALIAIVLGATGLRSLRRLQTRPMISTRPAEMIPREENPEWTRLPAK
jgi:hypothetical protein